MAVEHLGRDEEILPFAPVLLDDCFDGFAKGYLIVVDSAGVDVLAVAHLQSLPEEFGDLLCVVELVGAEADHWHDLLVREDFGRRPFLFLFIVCDI